MNSKLTGIIFSEKYMVIVSFLFLAGAGTVKSWASLGFLLMFLAGILTIRSNFSTGLEKQEKYWIVATIVFYFPLFLSLLNASDVIHGIHRVERVEYYLLSIVPYLYLRRSGFLLVRPFCFGAIISGPLMLAVALWDVLMTGLVRASGYYNPIFLGQIGVLVASICLVSLLNGTFSRRLNLLFLLSFFCAMGASILSGTRGSLFALPVVFSVCFFACLRIYSWKKIILGVSALVLGSVVFFSLANTDLLYARFQNTFSQPFKADIRYKIWQDAFSMWQGNEFIGTGFGDYEIEHKKQIADNTAQTTILFAHAHSIYIEFLATTGILGLLVMLVSLFGLPLYLFFGGVSSPNADERLTVFVGLISVLCFGTFGLTSAWTARSAANAIYAFCLVITLSTFFNLRSCRKEST